MFNFLHVVLINTFVFRCSDFQVKQNHKGKALTLCLSQFLVLSSYKNKSFNHMNQFKTTGKKWEQLLWNNTLAFVLYNHPNGFQPEFGTVIKKKEKENPSRNKWNNNVCVITNDSKITNIVSKSPNVMSFNISIISFVDINKTNGNMQECTLKMIKLYHKHPLAGEMKYLTRRRL